MCAAQGKGFSNMPHEEIVHIQPDTEERKTVALELFAKLQKDAQMEIIALAVALASQQ